MPSRVIHGTLKIEKLTSEADKKFRVTFDSYDSGEEATVSQQVFLGEDALLRLLQEMPMIAQKAVIHLFSELEKRSHSEILDLEIEHGELRRLGFAK